VIWWCIATVAAQQAGDTDLLRPAVDSRRFQQIQDGRALDGLGVQLSAQGQVLDRPYVVIDPVTGAEQVQLGRAAGGVMGAAFWKGRMRVGASVPLYWRATGPAVSETGTRLGDARLDLAWRLLPGTYDGFGAVAYAGVGLPMGTGASLLTPTGTRGWFGGAVDYELGPALVALNGAIELGAPNELTVPMSEAVLLGAGLAWQVHERVDLSSEVVVTSQVDRFLGLGQGTAVEGSVGTRVTLIEGVDARISVGTGLSDGVGAPGWRVLGGITWRPPAAVLDQDLDGVIDARDACPTQPEDRDGYMDADGCADPDDDGDGLLDGADACPRQAEDLDGWHDDDGCPEVDALLTLTVVDWGGRPERAGHVTLTDGTQTLELLEVSQLTQHLDAGTWTLRVETPGFDPWTHELVVDEGGPVAVTAQLHAPGEVAHVALTVADLQGQPLQGATVTVGEDLRPIPLDGGASDLRLQAGSHLLAVRAPGHAPKLVTVRATLDTPQALDVQLDTERVRLTQGALQLLEPIPFDPGSSALSDEARAILDQVATLMVLHDELTLVRIEVHTDNQGPESTNLDLSQRRADTVMGYLVRQGVRRRRLYAVGFGEEFPIATNDTDAGRAQNRRVAFYVEERR
jgi:outer membrane protein OmpA-like peptidoglycan-associated protein